MWRDIWEAVRPLATTFGEVVAWHLAIVAIMILSVIIVEILLGLLT